MNPPVEDSPRSKTRRRILWIAVSAVAVLAVLAAIGIWWFFKDDAPPAVDLTTATESLSDETDTDTSEAEEADSPPATAEPSATETVTETATATTQTSDVAGTWTVDTSVGEFSFEDSTGTFVGFRVEEELARIGSATAVGRTPEVTGTITIDDTTVAAVEIEADMTAITTNESRRDDRVQSALDTSTFPTATFELTEPIELGDDVAEGAAISAIAFGELTVHGVTQPVEIALDAQLVDDTIVVVGSVEIVFADYDVSVPSAPVVLSAEDHGIVELQLFLRR